MGRGIGWVDVHLLASAKLSGCALWTLDRKLAVIAREQRVMGVELHMLSACLHCGCGAVSVSQ
jgi:hypothetical protein